MASTKWKSQPASEKQLYWINKLADEKVTGNLDDVLLDTLADVASGQAITGGGERSARRAVCRGPASPAAAGWAPLVTTRPSARRATKRPRPSTSGWTRLHDAALAAAVGTARELGACVTGGDSDHSDREECKIGRWVHLGYDSDYYTECSCKEFIEATAVHEAARVAGLPLQDGALSALNEAEARLPDVSSAVTT